MRRRGRWTMGCAVGLVLVAQPALAAGLGIPLDGFIGTFETFVVGLGLLVGLIGLTGYVGSLMDNPFSNILAGSVGFFVKAGLLGGGTALMGVLGLVGGATL
ncbi:MAG TPA: hypothetical protein VI542_00480 [Candidatus Tectomicrobia bacterium]